MVCLMEIVVLWNIALTVVGILRSFCTKSVLPFSEAIVRAMQQFLSLQVLLNWLFQYSQLFFEFDW